MKKKILGVIALGSIALGTLASCGAQNPVKEPTVDTKETEKEKKPQESKETPSTEKKLGAKFGTYDEGLWVEFADSKLDNVKIEYANVKDGKFIEVDKELVRLDNGLVRADIVGLSAGQYLVRATSSNGLKAESSSIVVKAYDRSGYAHFTSVHDKTGVNVEEGVGAYKNDGTLKENTKVIYVSDKTKNTVKATINDKEVTGLMAILNAQAESDTPLDVRVLGTISTCQFNDMKNLVEENGDAYMLDKDGNHVKENLTADQIIEKGINSYSNDEAKGITVLDGLDSKAKYTGSKKKSGKYVPAEYDSAWNQGYVKNVKNVTFEGIGTDAMLFQWGLTWKGSSSIEVRNVTFDDYTEDACAAEGSKSSSTIDGFLEGHIWFHHNQFNEGDNNWDITQEQDKHEGDGSVDFKKNAFITVSYNHFYKNHKTGLIGGGDQQLTSSVTFHHNFYDCCSSRLPLGREANMHMYNNYYYKISGTCSSLRGNAYALFENCYYEQSKNPIELQETNKLNQKDDYGVTFDCLPARAKVMGAVYDRCSGKMQGTNVLSREEVVENNNLFSKTFDTDAEFFYYDAENKKTNVSYMTDAHQAKIDCMNLAGTHRNN